MTRVVVATAFGGPESLSVVEKNLDPPGPGKVRIEVRAAGINPADWKLYSGAMGADSSKLPMRLGFEAAGVVTETGPDPLGPAGQVGVGDEVICFRVSGAYASELVVKASSVVPKPQGMDWPEAAGLMLTGTTAVHCLTATGVARGETVLVHGAAGGVGQMLVQLAVARGARVVGTCGPGSADLVRGLGGEPVAYGDGLAERVRAQAPEGVHAAVDAVGTDEAVDTSLELVRDRSRIATIAAFDRAQGEGIKALGGGPGADPGTELRDAARLELVRLAEEGRLRVRVDRTYPLEQADRAHADGRRGHSHGKLVLVP